MIEMKKINQKSYEKALKWIVRILRNRKIRFSVLGGLAAYTYGSKRMLVDIDLFMEEKDFQKLLPYVKDYVVESPQVIDGKSWRCYYMELRYNGIAIEIGGNKCKIRDSKTGKWEKISGMTTPSIKKVFGINLPVIPKKELISYKKKLMRKVDVIDLKNLS